MKLEKTRRNLRPVYYKAIDPIGFKADKSSRTVSGYLAAFGNVDSDGDMLVRGCFAKSIQERGPESTTARKIAYLWMHNITEPIGHFTKLVEDEKGLYFEAYVDEIPEGDRVLAQYESGTLNQHSIGYRYVRDKCKFEQRPGPDGEPMEVYVCYELSLFEGSVVTLGANENTPYTGAKDAGEERIETVKADLYARTEAILKEFKPEKAYEIRQIISQYIALAEIDEPIKSLVEETEPQVVDWDKVINAIQNN